MRDPAGLCSDARGGSRHPRNHPPYAQGVGDTQVRRYLSKLEQAMARLAAGHGPFKDMSAIYPTLRMVHCERHYLFCLPGERAPALVVAILHERMDLMARLADRL